MVQKNIMGWSQFWGSGICIQLFQINLSW